MTINLQALKTLMPNDRYSDATGLNGADLREWKAIYFSVRELMVSKSYGGWIRGALADGSLEVIAPAPKDKNGNVVGYPEYSQDIGEFFSEKRQEFNAQFDAVFINATTSELLAYAKKEYKVSRADLLSMNAERMAKTRNRENSLTDDVVLARHQEAEAAKDKAAKKAKQKAENDNKAFHRHKQQQLAEARAKQAQPIQVVSLDQLLEECGDNPPF